MDKFSTAGLMTREYDRVKLHITVMNTLMRKDPSGALVPSQGGKRGALKDRESFDANKVLQVRKVGFGS